MNRHGDGEAGRLTVEPTSETDPFTVRVTGVLDMGSAGAFLQRTVALLDEHTPDALVLSVEDLEFVDSSGLRSFLEIREETRRRDIPLHLRHATTATQKLLEMVGLDETLEPVDRDRG
jgi:anti-anti-sigma factor